MTRILGNDLVWWTGILAGSVFVLLLCTAAIKQYNFKWFMRWQVKATPLHHWLGWILMGLISVHVLLAILAFNFNVFF